MSNKITTAVDKVTELIDQLSIPDVMSPEEALEFYEELESVIEVKIDGVNSDMGNG